MLPPTDTSLEQPQPDPTSPPVQAMSAPPILGYNGHRGFVDIPWPDYNFWGHEGDRLVDEQVGVGELAHCCSSQGAAPAPPWVGCTVRMQLALLTLSALSPGSSSRRAGAGVGSGCRRLLRTQFAEPSTRLRFVLLLGDMAGRCPGLACRAAGCTVGMASWRVT